MNDVFLNDPSVVYRMTINPLNMNDPTVFYLLVERPAVVVYEPESNRCGSTSTEHMDSQLGHALQLLVLI
jgi:hypothetical protein